LKGKEATVWFWGEEFESVGENCERYVSKKWSEDVKECSIWILARERNEGIIYSIVSFVSNPKDINNLAQRLFYAALFQGNTKIDFVVVRLLDVISSRDIDCHNSIKKVEREVKKMKREVAEKFSDDPKIRQIAAGREVVFIPEINLYCELESQLASKIVIEIIHDFFPHIRDFLDSLVGRLIREGLVKRVMGYKLAGGAVDLKVEDVEIRGEKIFVWLTRAGRLSS